MKEEEKEKLRELLEIIDNTEEALEVLVKYANCEEAKKFLDAIAKAKDFGELRAAYYQAANFVDETKEKLSYANKKRQHKG